MSDLIDRQKTIDAVNSVTSDYIEVAYESCALLPIEPEWGKGEWIYGEDENMVDGYRCSQCGFFEPWDYKYRSINFIQQFRFCPSCGAKMENSVD